MHLKQLKLVGFKSFVDSTIVNFPSQLVAVVGPNGCGKSNIIDAVRWVMGESSAKNLRGESMIDVIFNGSSHRKSLGQASVELIFDNSLGRLTGPFASYGEISVKRLVTRDGESSYFLNGNRCRRKDITDIFLGTGSGAKGYSIIGQGTISKMIEARPEELRAFLEEAAGVSKYKERRRETLQRIEHTRENMTRVADIREELDKQLQRLERQAKSAERYTILKEEEKICRVEIQALKWRDLLEQQHSKQKELQGLAIAYEQQQSLLTGSIKEKTLLNEKMQEVNEQVQTIQHTFYQLGTDIARLEEGIQQQEREKKRLEQDRQHAQADWQVANERLKQDQEELLNSQASVELLQSQLLQQTRAYKEKEQDEIESKNQAQEKEASGQEIQQRVQHLKSEMHLMQVNQEHVQQGRQQTQIRLEKLEAEQATVSLTDLQQVKIELEEKQFKLQQTQQFDESQFKECHERLNQNRLQLQEIEKDVHQLQDQFHTLNSEYAALVAAQKIAKQSGQSSETQSQWSEKPRLVELLKVDSQWQFACEIVLGDSLQAFVLEDLDSLWPTCHEIKHLGANILTMKALELKQHALPRLADKIQGALPVSRHNLELIYAAEHLDEALKWLPKLTEQESIITAQGFWLGKGWVKFVNTSQQDETGLIARQQKIEDLEIKVQALDVDITDLRQKRDASHEKLQKSLRELELYRLNLDSSNEALRSNEAAIAKHEQSLEHAQKILATSAAERIELTDVLEELQEQWLTFDEQFRVLESQYQSSERQFSQFLSEKQIWLQDLEEKNTEVEAHRKALHQYELEYDRALNKRQQITDRIQREQERTEQLQERLEQLALLSMQASEPGTQLQDQLAVQVMKHTEIETQLVLSREHLSEMKKEMDTLEKALMQQEAEAKRVQEAQNQVKMEEQAYSVRAHSVYEAIEESGFQARSVLENLPQELMQSQKEALLIDIVEKIKRLGAINLAAIEEFTSEQQRKRYLDEQYEDLNQALATLETAIEKMDKETHLRLEITFEAVNTAFKALFPRLFGGGRAQLELTCDNLLEAGIVVMAQPPGKRNSTIHLLSGGEKAMTAVALVFAIFQLNPSPFCMLDEVDAPLDDANVGRFCALVKEMSQFVQFLFITHNKITMELADHLIGVTMREPGVSRLVAVDVKDALTME